MGDYVYPQGSGIPKSVFEELRALVACYAHRSPRIQKDSELPQEVREFIDSHKSKPYFAELDISFKTHWIVHSPTHMLPILENIRSNKPSSLE